VAAALVSVCLVAILYRHLALVLDYENEKVAFVRNEIGKLDREISEIVDLPDAIAETLARKNIVEALQRDRYRAGRLLADVVRHRPQGVEITSLSWQSQASRARVSGRASSDKAARVFADALRLRSSDATLQVDGGNVSFVFEFTAP
jgi:type IV pilus assembly protein PilN